MWGVRSLPPQTKNPTYGPGNGHQTFFSFLKKKVGLGTGGIDLKPMN